jgi:hypothetical protein
VIARCWFYLRLLAGALSIDEADRTGLTDEGPPDRFRSETDVDETPQQPLLGHAPGRVIAG